MSMKARSLLIPMYLPVAHRVNEEFSIQNEDYSYLMFIEKREYAYTLFAERNFWYIRSHVRFVKIHFGDDRMLKLYWNNTGFEVNG